MTGYHPEPMSPVLGFRVIYICMCVCIYVCCLSTSTNLNIEHFNMKMCGTSIGVELARLVLWLELLLLMI